jgi:hypothetical protein
MDHVTFNFRQDGDITLQSHLGTRPVGRQILLSSMPTWQLAMHEGWKMDEPDLAVTQLLRLSNNRMTAIACLKFYSKKCTLVSGTLRHRGGPYLWACKSKSIKVI